MNRTMHRSLVALVALAAVVQAIVLFRFEVNWDEFLNLSMVYDYHRGDLREILQTAFIHFFHWVPYVSVNEVDQVIAARMLIAVFALATSWAIWASARQLTSPEGALFAVLAYWTFSYVLRHGLSLRTDTLAAAPIMVALWLALTRGGQIRAVALAGALIGFAGVMTIKAIFFVPTIVVIGSVRALETRSLRGAFGLLVLAGTVALGTFALLIGLHALTFSEFNSPLAFLERTTQATLADTAKNIFFVSGIQAIANNPVHVGLLFAALAAVVGTLVKNGNRQQGIVGSALLFPLLIPLIYRDMYPYFFTLVLPPVAIAIAIGYDSYTKAHSRTWLLFGSLCLFWAFGTANALLQPNTHQRQILSVIHQTFPADSRYISGRSTVSSLRHRGLFMSSWGMDNYRAANEPVMRGELEKGAPAFLLADDYKLQLGQITPESSGKNRSGLLPEDLRVLQANFVPFWGPIWIPGRKISEGTSEIEIFSAGTYVNRGPGTLIIDGNAVLPDKEVTLTAGVHSAKATEATEIAVQYARPAAPPPPPVFQGFLHSPVLDYLKSPQ
ncbi:ArnT family glycosyltransferase [Roseibium sp.]|uniref:ArnT family glycosyltransferase n=2 Tax=Roseibium sp. TaxID=1936156 RepID=UPI003D0FCC1A